MYTGVVLYANTEADRGMFVLDSHGLVLVYRNWLVCVRVVLCSCGDFYPVFVGAVMT